MVLPGFWANAGMERRRISRAALIWTPLSAALEQSTMLYPREAREDSAVAIVR
jgi:hypothetical protein